MESLDGWDVFLIMVAVYVAVTSLVRLMMSRRDKLVAEVQEQIAARRAQRKQQKRKAAERAAKEAA